MGRSAFSPEVISRSTRLLLLAMVVVMLLSEVRRVAALLRQLFASMRQRRGVWLFSREFPLQDDDTAAARPSASSPLRSPSNFGLERRRPVSEKEATIGDPLDDILQHWMQCELKLYALPTRIQLGTRLDLSGRPRDRTERCRESVRMELTFKLPPRPAASKSPYSTWFKLLVFLDRQKGDI